MFHGAQSENAINPLFCIVTIQESSTLSMPNLFWSNGLLLFDYKLHQGNFLYKGDRFLTTSEVVLLAVADLAVQSFLPFS